MTKTIKKYFGTSSPGFSLIEVAIALAVMGIVISFTIPPLLNIMQIGRMKTTEHHQHAILVALANYAARYGYLPCPCIQGSDSGIAAETCKSSEKNQGSVPYKTLGIPQEFALDGYRKPFVYAINSQVLDSNLADRCKRLGPIFTFCASRPDDMTLNVKDHNNKSVFTDQKSKPLAAALKAHPFQPNSNEFDYMAVVLESHHPAHANSKNRSNSTDTKTREFKNHPSPEYPYHVKWASRDFLMGYYGNVSCPKVVLENRDIETETKDRSKKLR